ncbi:UNVERIFIED_ORG: hypothetical protein ABIB19_003786 [Arthrobacter sp. UYEF10]
MNELTPRRARAGQAPGPAGNSSAGSGPRHAGATMAALALVALLAGSV